MQVFCNRSNKLTKQKCIAFFQTKFSLLISAKARKRGSLEVFFIEFHLKSLFYSFKWFLAYEILKKFSFSFKDQWYETVYIFAAILTWKVTLHKLLEKSFHTSVFFSWYTSAGTEFSGIPSLRFLELFNWIQVYCTLQHLMM